MSANKRKSIPGTDSSRTKDTRPRNIWRRLLVSGRRRFTEGTSLEFASSGNQNSSASKPNLKPSLRPPNSKRSHSSQAPSQARGLEAEAAAFDYFDSQDFKI